MLSTLHSSADLAAYWRAHPETSDAYVWCCWTERWHHLYAPGMRRQNAWRYEALGVDVLRMRARLPAEGADWRAVELDVDVLGERWTCLCSIKPASTHHGHTAFLLAGELGQAEAIRLAGKRFPELAKLGLRGER